MIQNSQKNLKIDALVSQIVSPRKRKETWRTKDPGNLEAKLGAGDYSRPLQSASTVSNLRRVKGEEDKLRESHFGCSSWLRISRKSDCLRFAESWESESGKHSVLRVPTRKRNRVTSKSALGSQGGRRGLLARKGNYQKNVLRLRWKGADPRLKREGSLSRRTRGRKISEIKEGRKVGGITAGALKKRSPEKRGGPLLKGKGRFGEKLSLPNFTYTN